jgi:hypothetical protein
MTGLTPTNNENPPHLNPLPSGEREGVRGRRVTFKVNKTLMIVLLKTDIPFNHGRE